MVKNQNNTGFTFTENMTCFMSWIFDFIANNPELKINYKELQECIRKSIIENPTKSVRERVSKDEFKAIETKWPSKVRMLFPPLEYMEVINLPEKREEPFVVGELLTSKAEPLITATHLFKEAIKTDNKKIIECAKQVFWSVLSLYCESLIKNYFLAGKEQYYYVTRYLIEFDCLDKLEFFSLFAFDNGTIDGCSNPSEWIEKKRIGEEVTFKIPEITNAWTYIMSLLEELGICYKNDDKYWVKNKNQLNQMMERISNV